MTASLDTGVFPLPSAAPLPDVVTEFPRRALGKGAALYRAGDPAGTVYRLEEGLLKLGIDVLTGKERIVGLAGPGDFVGTLTPGQARFQESAVALSPRLVVRVIPRAELPEGLRDAVAGAAGIQLGRLRDVLEDSELPVTARLARTLVRLGQRFGQLGEGTTVRLTLPLTHDNFAAMIGAARETTTAVLGEMRAAGVLTGTRGRYAFDRDAMSAFAVDAAFA